MGNEQFLVLSYCLVGLLCACFGLGAYYWLRGPADAIFARLRQSGLDRALQKLLPASLVALALSGFMSVDYYGGCVTTRYQEIVGDREYMLRVNREQMSSALDWIVRARFAWSGIVLLVIIAIRRERKRATDRDRTSPAIAGADAVSPSPPIAK
ncbi:MAG TPA: hypothetical protein VMU06_20880 [Stellaceae bacterium]|nr:hypothetical protein [Stellaceae bacterium]